MDRAGPKHGAVGMEVPKTFHCSLRSSHSIPVKPEVPLEWEKVGQTLLSDIVV